MAVYAGQGRQPFSAAQLLAMEEERKKRLAEAKANQAIMLEKDRTWRDKLAGRKSIQGQYWEAYPESAPRGFWGDLAYRHGATSNLFGAPEMQMGNAGIWADEQIDRQEAARNSQPNWSPAVGPNYNPTVESSPIVPRGETYTGPKNLSDEDAAAIYSQPVMTNDEIAEHGVGNTGFLNKNAKYGYMDLGEMMGRLRYNPDGTFSRLPTTGTGLGDASADALRAAGQHSIIPYIGMEKLGGGSIFGPGDWAADQLNRIEADREYNLPENVALREEAKKREEMHQAGLLVDEQLDKIEADRAAAKAEEMRLADIWATDEIVRQETEQLAARRAAEDAKKNRLAAIQAGIDADAGRTTEENYELYSGIDRGEMTPDSLLDGVTEAMESNEEWAADKAETIQGWIAGAKEGIITWGSIAIDKVLGLGDNDNDGLEQEEVEVIIDLAKDANNDKDDSASQDGLLDDSAKTTTDGLLDDSAKTTISVVSDDSIFTTAGDSTKGFTMDRLKNPLSPENKAWWLEKRPGDIPGNNRAVEFFNTLAYIGTPLKYRPAKTPSESLQERKIQHMNNQLDYAASQSTTSPTFASLRAAVPSHQVIEDTIRGQVEAGADKGFLGIFGGDDSDDIDNMIAEKALLIREKMLQMTLANNVIPSIQEAIDALSPPTTTTPPPPPPGEGDGVISAGTRWFTDAITGLF